ncbi:MAG: hypothetical protein GOU97_04960 [Nanoarchaeota archaeon]|nr:hypothetical protein [Nanoarchaeota archaeon]
MLDLKKLSDVFGMKVFTDSGEYFGELVEAEIDSNRISKWKVRATRESFLSRSLGGAKGVLIPNQLVRAFGKDIIIISQTAIPGTREEGQVQEDSPF